MTEAGRPKHRMPSKERWVKGAFLLITVVVVAAVIMMQRSGPSLPGWGDDLKATLAQAGREDRRVLAFFLSDPPGAEARWLADNTLHTNRKAIEDSGILPVKVVLDTALRSETARRYEIGELPTLMVLSPNGEELNRRAGRVGEVEFRRGFLDLAVVKGPEH